MHQRQKGVTDQTTVARSEDAAVSTLRCVIVWSGITVVAAAGTALGVEAVVDHLRTSVAPGSIDRAIVTGAGTGAAVLCPWLWLIASLSVFDALRGRVRDRAGWTRRLTLVACGVAVGASVVVSPAQATSGPQEPVERAGTVSLDGLPYPDRATSKRQVVDETPIIPSVRAATRTAAERVERPRAATATPTTSLTPDRARKNTHRVRAGDTLWALAAAATAGTDVPAAVSELHRRNRRVIGDDPDLIRPGQVLDLNTEGDESR